MISGISGVSDYVDAGASTNTTDTAKGTLGKDDFLKLLLAQLTHQDPLNPADAAEFSSQLAQFSSLEQLNNINDNLTSLQESQDSSNTFQALDIIGKEIEADGDTLSLGDTGASAGSFTIARDADCAVVISDTSGKIIKTIDMGSLAAGDHTFKWDGTNQKANKSDNGLYNFKIIAQDSSGSSVTATTKISGLVDRVNLDGDEPVLYVGSLSIPLSEVSDINLAAD
jgi:flagellar basal-body rod modification protein FlgD